jgi:hypothetical protein
MKEIPPLAGWPTQTSLVREVKVPRKKRRFKKYSKKTG